MNRPLALIIKTGYPLANRVQGYRSFFRNGWRVAVVDEPLHQGIGIADVSIVSDFSDVDHICAQVQKKAGLPQAVLTFNDSGLVLAAKVAKRFQLPHISIDCAIKATDKEEQHRIITHSDIPSPAWTRATTIYEIQSWLERYSSVVVKPADRAASAGVSLVEDASEVSQAFKIAKIESPSSRVIVEEYLPGPEFSVESVAVNSRQIPVAITRKLVGEPPNFIELGHSLPAELDLKKRKAIVNVAMEATQALGINYGACHTEIKLSPRGPVLIEVNARLGGDRIPELVHHALGIDLYALALQSAAGDSIAPEDLRPRYNKAAAIRFGANPSGKLHGVMITGPLQREAEEYGVIGERGMVLAPPTTNGGRAAYAIAVERSESAAIDVAEEQLRQIYVQSSEAKF